MNPRPFCHSERDERALSGRYACRVRTLVVNAARWLLLALMLGMPVGCASMSRQSQTEPPIIIVRNASGVDLRTVSLRAAGDSGEADLRVGSVSPVPKGASQVFARPSSRAPLPMELEVAWVDAFAASYTRQVSLEPALKEATGAPGEALVFEIRPSGAIAVYCE